MSDDSLSLMTGYYHILIPISKLIRKSHKSRAWISDDFPNQSFFTEIVLTLSTPKRYDIPAKEIEGHLKIILSSIFFFKNVTFQSDWKWLYFRNENVVKWDFMGRFLNSVISMQSCMSRLSISWSSFFALCTFTYMCFVRLYSLHLTISLGMFVHR